MKKYMKILRHGKGNTHLTIEPGSHITVLEKLDGANASFKLEDGVIKAFSRNNELDENNTLHGFYNWTQSLDKSKLLTGVIYFGEWLVKHKLDYGENANQFYLFDIYNTYTEEYVSFSIVKNEARYLNVNLVPVFYEGEFVSYEHLQSFVGKSQLGQVGEGIVVKNYSYKDKHGVQHFTKIVSDAFAEVKQVKKQRIAPRTDLLDEFVGMNLTPARVSKTLHKLVDEGVLKKDFDITDMGIILKNIGQRLYQDIIEEELDELLVQVKKKVGHKVPKVVKSVLAEEGRI